MKKGEIYEGIVERIDFPNKGIVTVDGVRVTVKNALPGQKIRFLINKKRSGRCEGRLMEVLEPSPVENSAIACTKAGICGGCLYQGFPTRSSCGSRNSRSRTCWTASVRIMSSRGSRGARSMRATAIRWSFPLATSTRTARWRWGCIREGASTIS